MMTHCVLPGFWHEEEDVCVCVCVCGDSVKCAHVVRVDVQSLTFQPGCMKPFDFAANLLSWFSLLLSL